MSADVLHIAVPETLWRFLKAELERAERLATWPPQRAAIDPSGYTDKAPSRRRNRRLRAKARNAV